MIKILNPLCILCLGLFISISLLAEHSTNTEDLLNQLVQLATIEGGSQSESAIRALKQQIEQLPKPKMGNPKTAQIFNNQGLKLLSMGKLPQARQFFQKAHQINPIDPEIVNNLGYAYLLAHDLSLANYYLLTALALSPSRSPAWMNLGQLYAQQGKLTQTIACFAHSFRFSTQPTRTIEFLQELANTDNNPLTREAARKTLQFDFIKTFRPLQKKLKTPNPVYELDATGRNWYFLPTEIANLTELKVLVLSCNESLEQLPREIGDLVSLQELNLGNSADCKMKINQLPPTIGRLKNLRKLNLSEVELSELPPEIGQLSNLREFVWNNGGKPAKLPKEMSKLTKLELLDLGFNHINEFPLVISALTNLKILDLRNNALTQIPTTIGHLKNLKELLLSCNHITQLPAEIGQLDKLESLLLGGVTEKSGNQLTTLPLEITKLKNLKNLSINNQFLSETEKQKIKHLLPTVKIEFVESNDDYECLP